MMLGRRFSRRRGPLAVLVAGSVAFASTGASAQSVGGAVSVGAAHALANDQAHELGFGPFGQATGLLRLGDGVSADLQFTALGLASGSAPDDPRLAARGAANFFSLGLGLQARPFVAKYDVLHRADAAGFWVGADIDGVLTGGLARAGFDAQLGYDFWVGPRLGVGPFAELAYVIQPNDSVRPDDAVLGMIGVRFVADPSLPKRELPPPPPPPVRYVAPPPPVDGDRDHDGIPDSVDKCPDQPEDKDGFEDEDGCPDPDNDKDGIPDVVDKCPNEPETFNGYADEDGCPDEVSVRVVGDEIVLDDRIYFEFNRAVILRRSWSLLQRLAKLLTDHPEYVRISIEGHADERGADDYNKKLSEARATAVRTKLVGFGVAGARLTVVGHGESAPRAQGHDETSYQQNRRVEFRITRQSQQRVGGPLGAPPPATPPPPPGPAGARPTEKKAP